MHDNDWKESRCATLATTTGLSSFECKYLASQALPQTGTDGAMWSANLVESKPGFGLWHTKQNSFLRSDGPAAWIRAESGEQRAGRAVGEDDERQYAGGVPDDSGRLRTLLAHGSFRQHSFSAARHLGRS